jgi:hypothetical protein
MTFHQTLGGLVKSLDIMDIFYAGFHIAPPRLDIILRAFAAGADPLKMSVHLFADFVSQKLPERFGSVFTSLQFYIQSVPQRFALANFICLQVWECLEEKVGERNDADQDDD